MSNILFRCTLRATGELLYLPLKGLRELVRKGLVEVEEGRTFVFKAARTQTDEIVTRVERPE